MKPLLYFVMLLAMLIVIPIGVNADFYHSGVGHTDESYSDGWNTLMFFKYLDGTKSPLYPITIYPNGTWEPREPLIIQVSESYYNGPWTQQKVSLPMPRSFNEKVLVPMILAVIILFWIALAFLHDWVGVNH